MHDETGAKYNHFSEETLANLAQDLDGLYRDAKQKVGDDDLAHIRNVYAYAKAIKQRSQELIGRPASLESWRRGIVLKALHTLLEFSELGHNVMHGCYDHLPDRGRFDSKTYEWDFVTDPLEWRTMHHNNHHPFTNIVGVDHDIGYSFLRLLPGQSWYTHNVVQVLTLPFLLMFHLYYFTLYTATSAARTEGRKVLSWQTFRKSYRLIRKHIANNYVREPLQRSNRWLPTFFGNYLGTIAGYNLTIFVLIIEHHADNVELFHDPGPNESKGAWYLRQLRATTNFLHTETVDEYFKQVLREEVVFDNPPDFEVFYGGLDTHLEHHLFPDLPCSMQRKIRDDVKAVCHKYDIPYNIKPMDEMIPALAKSLSKLVLPIGEFEVDNSEKPKVGSMGQRVWKGSTYQQNYEAYMRATKTYNVAAKVLGVSRHGRMATSIRIALPKGWEALTWRAGAYISLMYPDGAKQDVDADQVRQYSVLRDSDEATKLGYIEITVKHVENGRVSGKIMQSLGKGDTLRLIGPPVSSSDFCLADSQAKTLLVAAGVGITPLLSMARTIVRSSDNPDVQLIYFNRDER